MYADSSRRQNKRVGNYVVIKFMQGKLAGVWLGGIAPLQKIFSILSLKMATFSAFWVLAHAARGPWPLPAPLGSASGIVHNATDEWQKRIHACMNEKGHFERLL